MNTGMKLNVRMKMNTGMKMNTRMNLNIGMGMKGHHVWKWMQFWCKWRHESKCMIQCTKYNVWMKDISKNTWTCISELTKTK